MGNGSGRRQAHATGSLTSVLRNALAAGAPRCTERPRAGMSPPPVRAPVGKGPASWRRARASHQRPASHLRLGRCPSGAAQCVVSAVRLFFRGLPVSSPRTLSMRRSDACMPSTRRGKLDAPRQATCASGRRPERQRQPRHSRSEERQCLVFRKEFQARSQGGRRRKAGPRNRRAAGAWDTEVADQELSEVVEVAYRAGCALERRAYLPSFSYSSA
jgi:hypothetical protein